MPQAARLGDPTAAGAITVPGQVTVTINSLPAAVAALGQAVNSGNGAAAPFPVGSLTVYIGGYPALRVGDSNPVAGPITLGSLTVTIG